MHTQRLSRILMVSVVIFVAAVAVVLVARGRGRVHIEEKIASKAEYRVKQIHLSEETRGGVRWTLDADQAETFEQLRRTTLKKVRITITEPAQTWTVTGDEGELSQESKDLELRGHVVLVSSQGLRLETTRLRWSAKDQRAWTQEPVTVYRSGAVVQGRGLDARVGEQVTQVKGRVRATFGGARAAGDATGALAGGAAAAPPADGLPPAPARPAAGARR